MLSLAVSVAACGGASATARPASTDAAAATPPRTSAALSPAGAAATQSGTSTGDGAPSPEGAAPPGEAPRRTPRTASAGEVLAGPGRITRRALDAVLDRGLGAFLGRLELEPAREGDRFVGYRLVAYRRPGDALAESGLQPGDVLTRVNGQAVVRPEHAFTVWQALRVASGVSVEYLRAGRRRELRFEIVD
jgi:S1-C subfamily serine protease